VVLLGATKTADGDLLGVDGSARTTVRVDAQTGETTVLGTWDGQIYDMAYSKLFSDENTDRVHMISGSYWMPAKDPAQTFDTDAWDLFDYLFEHDAYEFVAIAVGDIVTIEDQGQTYEAEELFLLDDNGNIWKLQAYFDGQFYNSTEPVFYASNLQEQGWSAVRLSESVLTLSSLVMGQDGNLYFSAFTGTSSDFYQLTMDDETMTCQARLFANSGDEVWPAMLVEVTDYAANTQCDHAHVELVGAKEANCVEEGYTGDKVCADCGLVLEAGQVLPVNDQHTYGPWVVITEPTADTEGLREHTCAHCGHVEQEVMAPVTVLLGDVNGDGRVNARDARILLKFLAGLVEENEVDQVAADFNNDGKVNARDARAILIYIAQQE
jgi:hypothetical protein